MLILFAFVSIHRIHRRRHHEMTESNSERSKEDVANDGKLLRPGVRIRPDVQEDQVRRLAERLYGISCLGVTELNAYDDRNFLIESDPNVRNPILSSNWSHGYVMKVLNALDSKKISFLEGQTEMMIFLRKYMSIKINLFKKHKVC